MDRINGDFSNWEFSANMLVVWCDLRSFLVMIYICIIDDFQAELVYL